MLGPPGPIGRRARGVSICSGASIRTTFGPFSTTGDRFSSFGPAGATTDGRDGTFCGEAGPRAAGRAGAVGDGDDRIVDTGGCSRTGGGAIVVLVALGLGFTGVLAGGWLGTTGSATFASDFVGAGGTSAVTASTGAVTTTSSIGAEGSGARSDVPSSDFFVARLRGAFVFTFSRSTFDEVSTAVWAVSAPWPLNQSRIDISRPGPMADMWPFTTSFEMPSSQHLATMDFESTPSSFAISKIFLFAKGQLHYPCTTLKTLRHFT